MYTYDTSTIQQCTLDGFKEDTSNSKARTQSLAAFTSLVSNSCFSFFLPTWSINPFHFLYFVFCILYFVFCILHFVFVFVFCITYCMIVPGKPTTDHIAQALLDALAKLVPWKDYDGTWCRTQWFQHPPWQYDGLIMRWWDGNMISKCHPMSPLQLFAARFNVSLHI